MDSLGTVLHLRIRPPCRVVPLIVLARPVECRELGMDRSRRWRLRRDVRRARKRRTHQRQLMEDVRTDEGRPCGDRRAEIVTGQQRSFRAAERVQQPHDIAREVEEPIGREVAVIVRVPARRAPVAALVRRDDMEARLRQGRHDAQPEDRLRGHCAAGQPLRGEQGLRRGARHTLHAKIGRAPRGQKATAMRFAGLEALLNEKDCLRDRLS